MAESDQRGRIPSGSRTMVGVGLPADVDSFAFDATIARPSMRDVASVPPEGPAPLPKVSVDLGGAPADSLPPGQPMPDLSVHGLLGEGGMGQVHVAHQRSLHRDVAVKTVRQPMDARSAQALCREAVLTGRLEHPGIVPVHAFGQAPDGRPVMIMKRVEGVSWADLLGDTEHPAWIDSGLPSERLVANLTILMRVCHAVHFAHDRGFLHRDLKPENVMIGRYGEVYVVDWGLGVRIDDQADSIGAVVGTRHTWRPR